MEAACRDIESASAQTKKLKTGKTNRKLQNHFQVHFVSNDGCDEDRSSLKLKDDHSRSARHSAASRVAPCSLLLFPPPPTNHGGISQRKLECMFLMFTLCRRQNDNCRLARGLLALHSHAHKIVDCHCFLLISAGSCKSGASLKTATLSPVLK